MFDLELNLLKVAKQWLNCQYATCYKKKLLAKFSPPLPWVHLPLTFYIIFIYLLASFICDCSVLPSFLPIPSCFHILFVRGTWYQLLCYVFSSFCVRWMFIFLFDIKEQFRFFPCHCVIFDKNYSLFATKLCLSRLFI